MQTSRRRWDSMAMRRHSKELRGWIDEAISLSGHQDGAVHAAAGDTLAIAMQQGPRAEQQDCGAALLWVPRFGYSPRCAAVIADGMGGMQGGGWSSRHTVRVLLERCLSDRHDTPRDMLARRPGGRAAGSAGSAARPRRHHPDRRGLGTGAAGCWCTSATPAPTSSSRDVPSAASPSITPRPDTPMRSSA